MIPVWNYDQVSRRLIENFRRDGHTDSPRMVGILFARPDTRVASSEIIPSLNYFHHRAGRNIDFYCVGYNYGGKKMFQNDAIIDNTPLHFDDHSFNEFRTKVESLTSWRYSGQADLILLNARLKHGKAVMDFNNAICCDLDKMLDDESITTVGRFFEEIFQYAESVGESNPTWGFSDQMGIKVGGSSLKKVVMDLLLRKFSKGARQVSHFAVRDIESKDSQNPPIE